MHEATQQDEGDEGGRATGRWAQWTERVDQVLEIYQRGGQRRELTPWERGVAAPMQVVALAAREAKRDRVVQEAATLAFFTVLSLVPLLAVVTALLGAYGVFDPVEGDLASYLEVLFPAAGMEIVTYLQEFSTRGASSIGGINGVVLLVISIFLFNSIERSLTNIWRGQHDRPLIAKFLMFYTMITLGPLLVILSVVQTASAQLYVTSRFGIDTGAINHFLPVIYTLAVFALMNKILPHAHVTWRAALIGGVVTAVGFELAKWGFNQYVNLVLLDSYNRLYGALGIIPIVLLWIFITWIVILVGSEVAYCYQHMGRLLRHDVPLKQSLREGGRRPSARVFDELVGLDLLSQVVNAFKRGGGVSEATLGAKLGYEADVIRDCVDVLLDQETLIVVGKLRGSRRMLMPARDLEELPLEQVWRAFREAHSATSPSRSQALRALRERCEVSIDEELDGLTARHLLARDEPGAHTERFERDARAMHEEDLDVDDDLDEL